MSGRETLLLDSPTYQVTKEGSDTGRSEVDAHNFRMYAILKPDSLGNLKRLVGRIAVLTAVRTQWSRSHPEDDDVYTASETSLAGKIIDINERGLKVSIDQGFTVSDGQKIKQLQSGGSESFEFLSESCSHQSIRERNSISCLLVNGENILPNFTEILRRTSNLPL